MFKFRNEEANLFGRCSTTNPNVCTVTTSPMLERRRRASRFRQRDLLELQKKAGGPHPNGQDSCGCPDSAQRRSTLKGTWTLKLLLKRGIDPVILGLSPVFEATSHPVWPFFVGQAPVFGRICPYGQVVFVNHPYETHICSTCY